jgi:hypothetical protein
MTVSRQVVARRLPVLGDVNAGKASILAMMGRELDQVRTGVWARFSGAKTAHLSKRQIRDRLMAEQAPADVGVPQRLWRATVEDTVDKIRAWQQAVITNEVRPKIYARTHGDEAERKRLLVLAKTGRWREDQWLSRQCRDAFASKRPRPRRSGRIVADNCSYDVQRDHQGRLWLAGDDPNSAISAPYPTSWCPPRPSRSAPTGVVAGRSLPPTPPSGCVAPGPTAGDSPGYRCWGQ